IEGANDAEVIDPVVLVEAAVLRGEQGVDEMVGDVVQGDGAAVLDENASQLLAMAIEDPTGHFDLLELREVKGLRQLVPGLEVEKGPGRCHHDGDQSEEGEKAEYLEPENHAATALQPLPHPCVQGRQVDHGTRRQGSVAATDLVKIDLFVVSGHGRILESGFGPGRMGPCARLRVTRPALKIRPFLNSSFKEFRKVRRAPCPFPTGWNWRSTTLSTATIVAGGAGRAIGSWGGRAISTPVSRWGRCSASSRPTVCTGSGRRASPVACPS